MSISSVQTNDICLKIIIPHPIINHHHETSVVSDNRLEATRSGFENIWAMTASRILHNTLFRIDFFALLCPKTNYFEYVHIYVWCFHSKTNKIKSFLPSICLYVYFFISSKKQKLISPKLFSRYCTFTKRMCFSLFSFFSPVLHLPARKRLTPHALT